jgi:hypothetical protein
MSWLMPETGTRKSLSLTRRAFGQTEYGRAITRLLKCVSCGIIGLEGGERNSRLRKTLNEKKPITKLRRVADLTFAQSVLESEDSPKGGVPHRPFECPAKGAVTASANAMERKVTFEGAESLRDDVFRRLIAYKRLSAMDAACHVLMLLHR